MSSPYKKLKKHDVWLLIIASGALLILNAWVLYQVLKLGNNSLVDENNLVENLQVFLYAFSGLILLINALRSSKLQRWLSLFFGVTCWLFVLRELDVEDLDVPKIFILLGSGKGRNALFIVIFAVLFYAFIKKHKSILKSMKQWRFSIVVQACLIGCLFLILGAVGDKSDLPLLEELSELNGAFYIALSAIIFIIKPELLTDFMREHDTPDKAPQKD